MLRIHAFQGLRPAPELASEIACVPYDTVDRDQASALADRLPNSLLRVDRAEIDLPPETDPCSEGVYQKALANFLALQSKGALIHESEPCLYLYQQRMGTHIQTGLAALCHVDDYQNGTIKKTETPRPDAEEDRANLLEILSANTGPALLTYRDIPGMDDLVAPVLATKPIYHFKTPDSIEHIVWKIPRFEPFQKAFQQVATCHVIDGHHRIASAARVAQKRQVTNKKHTGTEHYNWFLCVLLPASQLQILPYHRIVRDLNGLSSEIFLEHVSKTFRCSPSRKPSPSKPGEIQMYLKGKWYTLSWHPPKNSDPVSRLDVTALQNQLLSPILGIEDPLNSKRIDFIGGLRGTSELIRLVDSGKAAVAFSLLPIRVEHLMAVANSNQTLPPKTACIEPKLRSGLFIHTF